MTNATDATDTIDRISIPSSSDATVRLAWLAEQTKAVEEGRLSKLAAIVIWSIASGWIDYCNAEESRKYREAIEKIQNLAC